MCFDLVQNVSREPAHNIVFVAMLELLLCEMLAGDDDGDGDADGGRRFL